MFSAFSSEGHTTIYIYVRVHRIDTHKVATPTTVSVSVLICRAADGNANVKAFSI
jgi:hypothetical protein